MEKRRKSVNFNMAITEDDRKQIEDYAKLVEGAEGMSAAIRLLLRRVLPNEISRLKNNNNSITPAIAG